MNLVPLRKSVSRDACMPSSYHPMATMHGTADPQHSSPRPRGGERGRAVRMNLAVVTHECRTHLSNHQHHQATLKGGPGARPSSSRRRRWHALCCHHSSYHLPRPRTIRPTAQLPTAKRGGAGEGGPHGPVAPSRETSREAHACGPTCY